MTWLPETAPGPTPFERVFGLCPELHADVSAFLDLLWTLRPVDPVVLELCRIRVAQILGGEPELRRRSPAALACCLAEEKIGALAEWKTSRMFSTLERACLRLAEGFVLDPHGVSDADTDAVTAHLGAAATVALVEALALFDGFTRFRIMLDSAAAS